MASRCVPAPFHPDPARLKPESNPPLGFDQYLRAAVCADPAPVPNCHLGHRKLCPEPGHVCLHGKPGNSSTGAPCDIQRVFSSPRIDWIAVRQRYRFLWLVFIYERQPAKRIYIMEIYYRIFNFVVDWPD